MSQEQPSKHIHKRSRSLSLTLFLWFVCLSIGPVIFVGFNEYEMGKDDIVQDRYDQLTTINYQLTQRLNHYFDTVLTNLYILSSPSSTFIDNLKEGYDPDRGLWNSYVTSTDYHKIQAQHSATYQDFLKFYDYSDIIIGDAQGNILYTVNRYDDLGQNLFSGSLAYTNFSRAVQASLQEQQPQYADLGSYPPLGNEQVVFFILPLTDDEQSSTGFIAVQIHPNNIQIMFDSGDSGIAGLSSFLVGADRKIRFGSIVANRKDLIFSDDNPLIDLWLEPVNEDGLYVEDDDHIGELEEHSDHAHEFDMNAMGDLSDVIQDEEALAQAVKASDRHIRSYEHGEEVLGTYLPVNIAGSSMIMLSEVTHREAFASVQKFQNRLILLISIVFVLVVIVAFFVTRKLVKPLRQIIKWVNRVASGDYIEVVELKGSNEISELSHSFGEMTRKLRTISSENQRRNWLQDGMAGLNDSIRGEQSMADLCHNIVAYIAHYLDMHSGAMYVLNDTSQLELLGTYAWSKRNQHSTRFDLGEGLIGQAALEKQLIELTNVPDGYLAIESGLGVSSPVHVLIIPLSYENNLKGVFEFSRLGPMTEEQKQFLDHSVENIAIAINSAQYRTRVSQLLETTTQQAETMKEQQEELRSNNDELEKKARILEESEEELKAQSDELQKSNAELEELSEKLTAQKDDIERKNREIEKTSKDITEKAEELARASKYKSEFLANMSHELRTPLNSLLLLSQMLADNDEGNLTEDQVESATVIYNGGKELLELINDILDLSKVEAGKMSVNLDTVSVQDVKSSIETMFKPLADNKGLEFAVNMASGVNDSLFTDSQRLLQIIKNFLSNAFKFTEQGSVTVEVFNETRKGRHAEENWLAFGVKDSGIGIPKDKQATIFESFQQADGSTSRKYGGTGLGLAISREMATLLGGFIELASEEGKGTTFTLFLPDNPVCAIGSENVTADNYNNSPVPVSATLAKPDVSKPGVSKQEATTTEEIPITSTKSSVTETPTSTEGNSLLVIEDDPNFFNTLNQLAGKYQFNCQHAETGRQGLELAENTRPSAIILDLGLPDMDGQEVLEKLKNGNATRNIPVHIISGRDPHLFKDASVAGYLMKPVSISDIDNVFSTLEDAIHQDISDVLILDLDDSERKKIGAILEKKQLHVGYAATADEAQKMLSDSHWQCMIMDLNLGETSGLDFLQTVKEQLGEKMPSVVIHTAQPPSASEHAQLQEYTSAMVMKGDRAMERVTDEVSLFLHTVNKDNSVTEEKPMPAGGEKSLDGRKIMLVDDDLRNTFALSKALQGLGMEVVLADNGKNALTKLEEEEGVELVLMDIMMPVMDGYEATRAIRQMPYFKDLPVIALTAKAMADDRAKCLEAGANDYMTKPVDMAKLTEMLKVWLSR
ncbi:response regulator [Endozoicomonas ascidiicola]|uniref:response regulator n=1 Tax=Endozoicomonas ascidiicola TaxID=1698521 RepID=UPI00082963F2|nr:response regulator [Endozoicomonas ascidiicola]